MATLQAIEFDFLPQHQEKKGCVLVFNFRWMLVGCWMSELEDIQFLAVVRHIGIKRGI